MDALESTTYQELKRIALNALLHRRKDTVFSPTVLVHEVWLKLANQDITWQDDAHYLGLAARAMRGILIDHVRAKGRQKRGGDALQVTFSEALELNLPNYEKLEQLLTELESVDDVKARVVELKFFCGCSTEEIGEVLHLSTATVKRHWRFARAWLYDQLTAH